MTIEITPSLSIADEELEFSFIRASGPGGQNVNKVSSAVQMRFDARRSPSLSNEISIRLQKLAGSRLTQDGVIVITANRFRTQEANRRDAIERLRQMIEQSAEAPVRRRATRPSAAVKAKRLEGKARRSAVKAMRARPSGQD
ncbi:MAG TPA: alternative ribosome rescue aminoacyl-tRNA hydrolase ArfB [Caulobacteraceae bacterium]|nr:alternative ribosome rescue aminoacyl-tRNA hydrolase ArfB [Caulobacteraceae bacterium]